MATSTWKITCFAPPPLNAAMKCATDPKISSHPTSNVTPSPATPGSIIEIIPNTMKSTAAAIYHPVTFLATPIGLRKPSDGFNVAMRHLHAILFFGIGRRSEPARDGPGYLGLKHGDSIPIPGRSPQIFSFQAPVLAILQPVRAALGRRSAALQSFFFSASASLTFGGRDLILLMKAAAFPGFSSVSHTPFANIPDRRTPCFAIQKTCASVYSVPFVGRCGTGGNNTPGYSSGFPGVPWHPAHSFK